MDRFLLFFIAILICCPGWAQSLPSKRYTTSDGLVSDRVSCILQDEKGFMWFGTYFGLSRYDGYQFTTIPLPPSQQNKYVSSMAATGGKVYAGFWFDGGLLEYSNGRIKAYNLPLQRTQVYNNVHALTPYPGKGVLVAGGDNVIYHFADGRFRYLFGLDSTIKDLLITCLAIDKESQVWIGTSHGLFIYTKEQKVQQVSRKGVLYIRVKEGRMIVLSEGQRPASVEQHIFDVKTIRSQTGNRVYPGALLVPQGQNNGVLYCITDSSGRFVYINDGEPDEYMSSGGIPGNDIHYTYSDREHNLWVGTHTGLIKIVNMPVRYYSFGDPAPGTADITGDDSVTWVTNSKQLYTIRNGGPMRSTHFNKDTSYPGRLLHTGKQLWVSHRDAGLFKLEVNKDKIISSRYFKRWGKEEIKVHYLTQDATGRVWAGGSNGIFYMDNGKPAGHMRPYLRNGMPCFIVSMAVDAARRIIWAGDNAEGILKIKYRFENDKIIYAVEDQLTLKDGLTDMHIRSMLMDSKGNVWAGTRFGGLFRIREQEEKIKVENLTASAGLACTRVTHIKESRDGGIWIATCNGIYSYNPGSGKWQSYNSANGLQEAEVFSNFLSSNGNRCWAVSSSGVTALQFHSKDVAPPPMVNITRISVLGKEDTAALFGEAASYRPDENSIGFRFAGASYRDEKKLWYKYRLLGYDKSWSSPTQFNSVNYASLPSGDYTFEVLCSSDHVTWSEKPARFSFTIVTPFYKSIPFIILVLCAIFAALYFLNTYRLKQKLKLERLRTRISADLHDDIGSTLSSISIISEGALQEQAVGSSRKMIREINENATMLMDKMDDIIWCVNPQNDSFRNLMQRIRSFASGVLEARGMDYEIEMDNQIEDINLAPDQRQHIYLIIKEAINNLVKYSKASVAGIRITLHDRWLSVTISDNGIGFNTEERQEGNGLSNMKRRAQKIGAVLEIKSGQTGTTVWLRTKIK